MALTGSAACGPSDPGALGGCGFFKPHAISSPPHQANASKLKGAAPIDIAPRW